MNQQPSATSYIRKGNLPSGMGGFRYWTGSFKEAISASKDGIEGSPFTSVRTYDVSFQDTATYGDNQRAFLNDNDGFGSSSYISFKLKDGWQGLFYVRTENNDWFEDNVLNDNVSDDWNKSDSFVEELQEATDLLASAGYPSIWVQDNAEISDSRAVFALDGKNGDYVSFDIDAESSNVAQARIRIDGDDYVQNRKIDNEVFITMVWLRKWDQNMDLGGDSAPVPDPSPSPSPEPSVVCPIGFVDNGFGICVPIEPEPEPEPEPEIDPIEEVSAGAVLILLAGLAGVIYLGVKL